MKTMIHSYIIGIMLLIYIPSITVAQNVTTDSLAARINNIIKPLTDENVFSGAVLIAHGDNILYKKAFGYANWELQTPNTLSTRFGVASVTKAMTETIVEILIQKEHLDLDVPVEKYIDGFPRGPKGGKPTLRNLYNHRSGVPHRVTDNIEETQELSASDIVERVKKAKLLFEPGEKRLYSSAGFTVLARVLEIIEEKPFEQILNEFIFKPADMTYAISETGRRLMKKRAAQYILGTENGEVTVVNAHCKNLKFLTGAGSVYATVEDLNKFLQALHDGVYGNGLWDQAVDADAKTWRGWIGRTGGYEAYIDVLPAENLNLIILTNLRSMINWQLRAKIQAVLINRQTEPITLPPPVAKSFEPPESILGIYNNRGSEVVISLQDGKLFRGDAEIYPVKGNKYYSLASGSVISFRRNSSGEVDALIEPGGNNKEVFLLIR